MIHIDDIINFSIAAERMAGTSTLAAKLELYNLEVTLNTFLTKGK